MQKQEHAARGSTVESSPPMRRVPTDSYDRVGSSQLQVPPFSFQSNPTTQQCQELSTVDTVTLPRREYERLLSYRQGVQAILHAPSPVREGRKLVTPGWDPSDKLTQWELFDQSFDSGGRVRTSKGRIAAAIGVARPTVGKAIDRLALADLLAVTVIDPPHQEDKNGVRPYECKAQLTDTVDWKSLHWDCVTEFAPSIPREGQRLPQVDYQTIHRDRSARKSYLAAIGAELLRVACPDCKNMGEWDLAVIATCKHCGTRHNVEDLLPEDPAELLTPSACIPAEVLQASQTALTPPLAADPVDAYLLAHIGEDSRLIKQKQETDANGRKYISLPSEERPDLQAYKSGKIVYGARSALPGGMTRVLTFDPDGDMALGEAVRACKELAAAGAWPMFWQRAEGKGRLELNFSDPVHADSARDWALAHSPTLRKWADVQDASRECFPCSGGGAWVDRQNHPLGWPLTRLTDDKGIISCPLFAYGPEDWNLYSPGWLESPDGVRLAIQACITPASLIPAPVTERARPTVDRGGVSAPITRQARRSQRQGDNAYDEMKAAIDWWCDALTNRAAVDGLLDACPHKGNYVSVRANDKTPSTCADRDNYYKRTWFDYGKREKLDDFELYCRLKALDKRREVARVCADYRAIQGQIA